MTKTEKKVILQKKLSEVKNEYNTMFRNMNIDVKKERRLFEQEVSLMKLLNIFIYNPCPVNSAKYCRDCIGYYNARGKREKNGKWQLCSPDDSQARKCELKVAL